LAHTPVISKKYPGLCRIPPKRISERHRHRYEFNTLIRHCNQTWHEISGASPDGELVEIVEIADHPWFLDASSS